MSRVTIYHQSPGDVLRVALALTEDEARRLHLDKDLVTRLCDEVTIFILEEWDGSTPEWVAPAAAPAYTATVLATSTSDEEFLAQSAGRAMRNLLSGGHPRFT